MPHLDSLFSPLFHYIPQSLCASRWHFLALRAPQFQQYISTEINNANIADPQNFRKIQFLALFRRLKVVPEP